MNGKNIDQLSKEQMLKLDADYKKYDMILCLEELIHQVILTCLERSTLQYCRGGFSPE